MSTRSGLELGNDSLDLEHRVQVQMVDAMGQALRRSDPVSVQELAGQLEEYSNVHFGSEELLMRFHAYPLYPVHVEEHRRLLELLGGIRAAQGGADPVRASALVAEVRHWLSSHILGMDRLFSEFIAKKSRVPETSGV